MCYLCGGGMGVYFSISGIRGRLKVNSFPAMFSNDLAGKDLRKMFFVRNMHPRLVLAYSPLLHWP